MRSFLLFLLIFFSLSIDAQTNTYDLTVKVNGIKNKKVCIYLDENNNDQCDKNFFGIPTEKFAFSNNIRPILSIPSFESCSVYLNENKSIVIRADY